MVQTSVALSAVWVYAEDDELDSSDYDPGTDSHTYRVEVRGNRIRLFVDGQLAAHAKSNPFLGNPRVGIYTIESEEAAQVRGTPLEQVAKALVFRADGRIVLIVLPANRRIDTRAFKTAYGVKNLGMVSADELRELTGLEVGAVPPFGNLIGLPTYVDEPLLDLPQTSFNAGSRTFSVIMATTDYQRLADAISGRFASE